MKAKKRLIMVLVLFITQVVTGTILASTYQDLVISLYVLATSFFLIALSVPHFDNYIESKRPYRRSNALRHAGGSHTDQEWFKLKRRYGFKCANEACRKPETEAEPLTKDHVIPIFSGGTDNIRNIQPLCRSCNSAKGTRIIDYR